ncbi:MAG TPA: hypothetical protein DCZ72_07940 [Armatimonadetes bacterium]|nr:hypothetical protein [Armatimonadota bacterium]
MAQAGQSTAELTYRPRRTVFVGLGGSGLEVAQRVRRLIVQQFGSLAKLPAVKFVLLDTDTEIRDGLVRDPTAAEIEFAQNEFLDLGLEQTSDLFRNIRQGTAPQYDWFAQGSLLNHPSVQHGANGVRQLGRLCFWANSARIGQLLVAATREVLNASVGDFMRSEHGMDLGPDLDVVIVAGLSGGTGSGMFLDMAYMARQFVGQLNTNGSTDLVGHLVLPSAFDGVPNTPTQANGYAALRELNYFSYRHRTEGQMQALFGKPQWVADYQPGNAEYLVSSDKAPFDTTYLIGSSNGAVTISRDQVYAVMARSIFFEFAHEFAAVKRKLRANVRGTAQSYDALDCPSYFYSYGQASVLFPAAQVHQVLTHALARKVLRTMGALDPGSVEWVPEDEGDVGGATRSAVSRLTEDDDFRAEVRSWTASWIRSTLSEQQLLADVMRREGVVFADIPSTLFAEAVALYENENWAPNRFPMLSSTVERWQRDYDDSGTDSTNWGARIGLLADASHHAEKGFSAAIGSAVRELIADAKYGPAGALVYLELLDRYLEKQRAEYLRAADDHTEIARAIGDLTILGGASGAVEGSRSLSATLLERTTHEYSELTGAVRSNLLAKFIGHRQRVRVQAREYLHWAQLWCRAKIEERGRRLASHVCRVLSTVVDDLQGQVNNNVRALDAAEARLRIAHRERDQAAMQTENVGELLYTHAWAEDLIEYMVGRSQDDTSSPLNLTVLRQATLSELGIASVERLGQDDAPRLTAALLKAAGEAVAHLRDRSTSTTDYAAHDLIVSLLGGRENGLQQHLQQVVDKSKPYVALLSNPEGGSPATPSRSAGFGLIHGDVDLNADKDQQRQVVISHLLRADWGVPTPEQVERGSIRDTNEIAFFHELGNFALRQIAGIAALRAKYLDEARRNAAIHLWDPSQTGHLPDIIPPLPQALERGLRLQSVGLALGLFEQQAFPDTRGGEPQSYWAYARHDALLDEATYERLGQTEAAIGLQLATKPELALEIEKRLAAKVAAADEAERAAIVDQLRDYLARRRAEVQALLGPAIPANNDPGYKAEVERIQDFIAEAGLSS